MSESRRLSLSLGAKTKESPAGTATVASSVPLEQLPVTVEHERTRRRHMSRLYTELGALLPDLPPRASRRVADDGVQAPKTRILEEAIAYVGALRGTVAELEACGALAEAGRRTAADGVGVGAGQVLAAGKASCFAAGMPALRRPGVLTRVLEVFRRHGVPVLAATVTINDGEAAVMVTTAAVAPSVAEGIKSDISISTA